MGSVGDEVVLASVVETPLEVCTEGGVNEQAGNVLCTCIILSATAANSVVLDVVMVMRISCTCLGSAVRKNSLSVASSCPTWMFRMLRRVRHCFKSCEGVLLPSS